MSAAIRCAEVLNIDKNSLSRSKRRENVNCVSDLPTTQYMETSNNRKRLTFNYRRRDLLSRSILCQQDAYLLELVRYLHLNPLRARLVANLSSLDNYSFSGHSVIMDRRSNDWQNFLTYRPQSYGCQVNILSGYELKVFYVTWLTGSWGSAWQNYHGE